jgi:hypothetical protein
MRTARTLELTFDFSDRSLAAMREWLKDGYDSLAALKGDSSNMRREASTRPKSR